MKKIELTILPEARVARVPSGITVMDGLKEAGISLRAPCAGEGTCGKCLVRIKNGEIPMPIGQLDLLTEAQLLDGYRIACKTPLRAATTVEVLPTSRATEMRILLGGRSRKVALEPNTVKRFLRLRPQTLGAEVAEIELLKQAVELRADLEADADVLREFSLILEQANRQVTLVTCDRRIIAIEPGDTTDGIFGLALDVGTTTVVGALIDLSTGKELAIASAVNRQAQYGHDVITRIKFSTDRENGLRILREAASETVNEILATVAFSAEVSLDQIYEITVVGNATMSHLLLGISPQSLGRLPFAPVFSRGIQIAAEDVGLEVNRRASVSVLPNIAGFVGADTVGALLASGFDEPDGRIRLLVDIGTNCEIVLRREDELYACSTPAGPAFEGANISSGMYASDGAIEQVCLNGDCTYRVIGGKAPQGICGSGLVDIAAELLRVGIVDSTGRMLPEAELPEELPQALRSRVVERDGEIKFVIVGGKDSIRDNDPAHAIDQAISLRQRDVRELQLAKAAIRTGIDILLQQVGLSSADLDELCIAGGFGSYLDKDNAIRLGLIPYLPRRRIRILGNAAIGGAKLAMISTEMRRRAEIVARETRHVQIAERGDFQTLFADAMMFE